jgi:uncharacterized damage-inducible protein DinB
MMSDAFRHHVWATIQLIDACSALDEEQLQRTVPGTYGSIKNTLRHLVFADSWYLFDLTNDPARRIDENDADFDRFRSIMEADATAWVTFLAEHADPDVLVKEIDEDDGFERDAPIGVRLAQALCHGTDHRSQICTVLTSLGIQPPGIDVWNYGVACGRSVERMP